MSPNDEKFLNKLKGWIPAEKTPPPPGMGPKLEGRQPPVEQPRLREFSETPSGGVSVRGMLKPKMTHVEARDRYGGLTHSDAWSIAKGRRDITSSQPHEVLEHEHEIPEGELHKLCHSIINLTNQLSNHPSDEAVKNMHLAHQLLKQALNL